MHNGACIGRRGQFFTTFVSATFVVRYVVSVGGTLVRSQWVDETFDCMSSVAGALQLLEICAIEDVRSVAQICFRTLRAKHSIGRHLRFRFSIVTRRSFLVFRSSVMSETKAPSAEELAAVKLKNAQTKEGGAFDEAPYKAVWESSGGDGAKAAETIGLQGVPASYDEYIALVKSGKFKD